MEDRFGLDDALAIWRRRKWLALAVFAVPLGGLVALVMFLPNIYQSTATVVVQREQVPEGVVKPTVTSALETRLHGITQEILSRARLEELITRFDLYADRRRLVSQAEIIEQIRQDIRLETKSVEPRRGGATVAFAVSYRGRDPATVAEVANTLASFYIEENVKVRSLETAPRPTTGTRRAGMAGPVTIRSAGAPTRPASRSMPGTTR